MTEDLLARCSSRAAVGRLLARCVLFSPDVQSLASGEVESTAEDEKFGYSFPNSHPLIPYLLL